MGVVVGAPVAIGVSPLSVRCCGVWSEVVGVRLRVVVDLWGSDKVAQAVPEATTCLSSPPSQKSTVTRTHLVIYKRRSVDLF